MITKDMFIKLADGLEKEQVIRAARDAKVIADVEKNAAELLEFEVRPVHGNDSLVLGWNELPRLFRDVVVQVMAKHLKKSLKQNTEKHKTEVVLTQREVIADKDPEPPSKPVKKNGWVIPEQEHKPLTLVPFGFGLKTPLIHSGVSNFIFTNVMQEVAEKILEGNFSPRIFVNEETIKRFHHDANPYLGLSQSEINCCLDEIADILATNEFIRRNEAGTIELICPAFGVVIREENEIVAEISDELFAAMIWHLRCENAGGEND